MERLVARVSLPVPVDEAFAWHERPGALERLSPPWDKTEVIERSGTIHDGDRVVIRSAASPIKIEVRHHDYVAGRSFSDEMVKGPFAQFHHVHAFMPDGDTASINEDRISYALPLGIVGKTLGGSFVRAQLTKMFEYRHGQLRRDLVRHAEVRDQPRLKFAITGASGVLGVPLAAFLTTGGHEVLRLVRRRTTNPGDVFWDPDKGEIDAAALEGVDAVIHLAGENVGVRWNAERKRRIVHSRVAGTDLIARTIASLPRPPRVLISASGVGIYGIENPDTVDETGPLGDDFLADVCRQWEAAAEPSRAAGIRTVNMRIGVVLTPTGGALAQLLPVFRRGVGGPVGNGRQVMSWISLDDVIGAIYRAVFDTTLVGPVNAVAPNPVTNAELAATLGRILHRPALLRAPAFAVKALFGEMGTLVALGGQRVAATKLTAAGVRFDDPELEPALRRVLGQSNKPWNGLISGE